MSLPNLNVSVTNSWGNLERYNAFVKGKAENSIITLNDAGQGNNSGLKAEKGDTFRGGSWLGRNLWGGKTTAANNNVRNDFLQSVLDAFGVKDAKELPETVRTALEMKNFDGKGHPLTARRITSVLNSAKAARAEAYDKALRALSDFVAVDKDLAFRLIEELETCSVARMKQLAGIGGMSSRIDSAVDELKLPPGKAKLCKQYALRLIANDSNNQWQNLDESDFMLIGGLDDRALDFLIKQQIDVRKIAFCESSIFGAGIARKCAAPILGRLIVQTLANGEDTNLGDAYSKLCEMCKCEPGNVQDVKSAYMGLLGRMVDGIDSFNFNVFVEEKKGQLSPDVLSTVNQCRTLLKGLYNTHVEMTDNILEQAQNLTKIANRCVERLVKESGFDKEKARAEVLKQLNMLSLETVEDQKRCLELIANADDIGNADIEKFVDRITQAANYHLTLNERIEAKEKQVNELLGRTVKATMIHASTLGCNLHFNGYPLMDFDKPLNLQDHTSGFNKYARKTLGAFESVITSYKNICNKIDALPNVDENFKNGMKARAADYGVCMDQVEAILTNDKFWNLMNEAVSKDSDLVKAVSSFSSKDESGSMTRIASAALKFRSKCRELCKQLNDENNQNVGAKKFEGNLEFHIFERFASYPLEIAGEQHKLAGNATGKVKLNKNMTNQILENQMRKDVNLRHPLDRLTEPEFMAPEITVGVIGWFFNMK